MTNKNYKKIILSIGIVLVLIGVGYWFTSDKKSNLVNNVLIEAQNYKIQNSNYGLVVDFAENNYTCFSGNTFLRTPKVQEVLADMSVQDVSCKFEVNKETKILEKWSVSLIVNGKVYCGDSSGANNETPGVTLTVNCSGE